MKGTTISRAILGTVVLAALVAGSAAQASNATVVTGTTRGDRIQGMNGPQIIYGRGGADRINGGKGPDILYGGLGDDVLTTGKGGATEAAYGGRGNDVLKDFASGQSLGLLAGGPGRDLCIGDKHDTFRSCEVIKLRPHWE
jgi:Ca2+-binding RTX toxin-like protein